MKNSLLYTFTLCFFLFFAPQSFGDTTVATVGSWGSPSSFELPYLSELNTNWSSYGSTPLTINTSLHQATDFTYQDLVNTGADVLWLSNSAGGSRDFTVAAEDAIKLYVQQGHSIFGTFKVFQHSNGQDNRELAPLFGLRKDLDYDAETGPQQSRSFDILIDSPLFNNIPDPYVSSGHAYGFTPSDDNSWDPEDLGSAEFLAKTPDDRGVITWFQTDSYHAIYVSQMIEYNPYSLSTVDAQFLYNALTIPEPATLFLLGLGAFVLRKRKK